MKPKSAVVFGGSGFLGSHVADELTCRGFDVTVYDLTPSPFLSPQQQMVIGDIMDVAAVTKTCQGKDYVYNFAGMADIHEAMENPFKAAQLNILGNLNILEAARLAQAKRFVFASSVYVYSRSGSFYRASKQASESFVELYFERYQVPYTILRYGSLYGRRSDAKNAIHQFIASALTEGRIHYRGTGEELREYIHAQDAARASVDILAPEFENQHLILTGQRAQKVSEVLFMIAEILQRKIEFRFENEDSTSHYNITPYVYKPPLGRKLTTNPFVDIGQGILDCIHEISEKLRLETPPPLSTRESGVQSDLPEHLL